MKYLLTAMASLLFLILPARAETFIVTTNADAGPGSLREAIEKANNNGTGETDYIHFGLADQSLEGRTITLLSELPALTSHLVVDGSTQPGANFYFSQAKLQLRLDSNVSRFTFLQFHEAVNVEIYGLCFFSKYSSWPMGSWTYDIRAIDFDKSSDITIGAPGKGNAFMGIKYAITSFLPDYDARNQVNCDRISISSNQFNINKEGGPGPVYYPDGTFLNPMEYALNLYNCSNIILGGASPAEGNFFASEKIMIRSYVATGNGFVVVQNNKMGVRYDGTHEEEGNAVRPILYVWGDTYGSHAEYQLTITENDINGCIDLEFLSKRFIIQGNRITHDIAPGYSTSYLNKIYILSCNAGGIIGGANDDEINYFSTRYCFNNILGWNESNGGSVVVDNSPGITIQQNRMVNNSLAGSSIAIHDITAPVIRIDRQTATEVSGMATPNSRIEVFLDDECKGCDGEIYLGQVESNADSTWSFSGVFGNRRVIATSTKNNMTSGYTEPLYDVSGLNVQQPTCGMANGSVKGVTPTGTWTDVEWHQTFMEDGLYKDTVVARTPELLNVPAGSYYIINKWGESCRSRAFFIQLRDYTPKIDTSQVRVIQPSCGVANGSILYHVIRDGDYAAWRWEDSSGQVISDGPAGTLTPLGAVKPGHYRLVVTDTVAGCIDSTRFYVLSNQSGPSLNYEKLEIKAASCENNNGSIKGIRAENVQGSPYVEWTDSTGAVVANGFDLLNAYPGKYRLKFKDEGGCDTLLAEHTIPDTGAIVIDTTGLVVNASTCRGADGSILNITVVGATKFQWQNIEENREVTQTRDAVALAAGNYQLIVSNETGCSKSSPVITVSQKDFTGIVVQRWDTKPASCDLTNGYIDITEFSADTTGYAFRWIDSTTQNILSNHSSVRDLGGGIYHLYAVDKNGCEKQILSQVVPVIPAPSFDTTALMVTDDVCSTGSGRIQNIKVVNQGTATTFSWVSDGGLPAGNTIDAKNLGAGNYILSATDGNGCSISTSPVSVENKDQVLPAPAADGQTIVKGTPATIQVKNLWPGTYQFFNAADATVPVWQSTTGSFKTPPLTESQTFYVQLVQGSCTSGKAPVAIEVLSKQAVYIPTGFTPNNDGKNDRFKATVMGFLKTFELVVYNRWGQVVFQTQDPDQGWDGKVNKMPQGNFSYVWTCRYQFDGEAPHFEKGVVTVIR